MNNELTAKNNIVDQESKDLGESWKKHDKIVEKNRSTHLNFMMKHNAK